MWTQSRYFFFSLSFFSAFLLFWVFAVSGFFGGLFFERNEKTKKDKIQNKTTKKQKRKKDHKMQTKRPLSLVTKKATTQKQNYTNEFFKLERNNTRKTNKNKHINHKNQTTLLTNRTIKNTRIAGKTAFFQRLKAKQERIKTKTQNKTKQKHQKQSQHNNKKQKGWDIQNENKNNHNRRKKKQPKTKANWISKKGM